jgi:adenylosuccinate lyase
MKLEGVNNAYELIKKQTHGSNLNRSAYLSLIEELDISEESKIKLRNLTPSSYLGIASKLAKS